MTTMKNPPDFPSHLPPLPEWPSEFIPIFRGEAWLPNRECIYLCFHKGAKRWAGSWNDSPQKPSGFSGALYAELVPIESPAEPDYSSREYQKSVLDAAWDGVPCQYFNPGNNCWIDEGDWHSVANSIAQGIRVRIKPMEPAKKRIPLTAEDIPAVCWVRFRVESPNVLIHSIDSCGVSYAGKEREQEVTFQELMRDGWEYSQDRRNWKPCYKETEE